ncbi:MAG: hypothetical protein MZV64_48745 [Ignavibacteriales bacterium]|nr:hypothetical protein [Ignavibacteriales bacterium]
MRASARGRGERVGLQRQARCWQSRCRPGARASCCSCCSCWASWRWSGARALPAGRRRRRVPPAPGRGALRPHARRCPATRGRVTRPQRRRARAPACRRTAIWAIPEDVAGDRPSSAAQLARLLGMNAGRARATPRQPTANPSPTCGAGSTPSVDGAHRGD